MDILKARKKAAERKRAQKKKQPEPLAEAQPKDQKDRPHEQADQHLSGITKEETDPINDAPLPEEPSIKASKTDVPAEAALPMAEFLTFRLSGEEYALPVEIVREVLKIRSCTPVPNAAAHVLGITSLRGAVLPVVDLCGRLGLAPGSRDVKSRILVLNTDEEDIGLVVDRVTGVLKVPHDAIQPVPEHIEHGAELLDGIVRKNEKLYILLSLERAVP
ncbi:MAG: chemotaxis protein CheW [Nitrospirota bacterium]